MNKPISTLREEEYTGLSYDGGRTSLPYAIWVKGAIVRWTADKEVVERKIKTGTAKGRLVFTE